jgi:cobalt-zinc-cadmium resistance protein CzcA
VTTAAPGLAAEEVEQQITVPLERALNGVPGLAKMRSNSTFGLSIINMRFRDGYEDYWVRQRVTERISDVTLPSGTSTSLIPMTAPEGEIFRYTVESDSKNLMELSEIHRWIIIPALQQVPGVANADNFGGFTKEFRLDLDATELLRYDVGINDVTDAVNANSANAGGGARARPTELRRPRRRAGQDWMTSATSWWRTRHHADPGARPGTLTYTHQSVRAFGGREPDTIEGIVQMLVPRTRRRSSGSSRLLAELKPQLDALDAPFVPYIDRGISCRPPSTRSPTPCSKASASSASCSSCSWATGAARWSSQ